jgi:hypothetical protein
MVGSRVVGVAVAGCSPELVCVGTAIVRCSPGVEAVGGTVIKILQADAVIRRIDKAAVMNILSFINPPCRVKGTTPWITGKFMTYSTPKGRIRFFHFHLNPSHFLPQFGLDRFSVVL